MTRTKQKKIASKNSESTKIVHIITDRRHIKIDLDRFTTFLMAVCLIVTFTALAYDIMQRPERYSTICQYHYGTYQQN